MSFEPQPDPSLARARRVVAGARTAFEREIQHLERRGDKAAAADIRAVMNAMTNTSNLRLGTQYGLDYS